MNQDILIEYKTGDKVWLNTVDGRYAVVRLQTYDGITWQFGDKQLTFPAELDMPLPQKNHIKDILLVLTLLGVIFWLAIRR